MITPKEPKPTPAESRRAFTLVAERSFGLCEGCGKRAATQMHHRLFKSRGGQDFVVNLLHLCGSGNMLGCHGAAHMGGSAAEDIGWAIRSGGSPADVQVVYRGQRVYLTADGGLKEVT